MRWLWLLPKFLPLPKLLSPLLFLGRELQVVDSEDRRGCVTGERGGRAEEEEEALVPRLSGGTRSEASLLGEPATLAEARRDDEGGGGAGW